MRKILSLIIVVVYFIYFSSNSNIESAFQMGLFFIIPLGCIWFSENMGNYKGSMHIPPINEKSPGCVIEALGWFLLFAPIWLYFIIKISTL